MIDLIGRIALAIIGLFLLWSLLTVMTTNTNLTPHQQHMQESAELYSTPGEPIPCTYDFEHYQCTWKWYGW